MPINRQNQLLEAVDADGYTRLHLAILYRNWQLLYWLIADGANLDAVNYHDLNALTLSLMQRDYHAMSLLIENGALLEAENSHGETALHTAVINQDLIGMNLLLNYHADVRARDENGNTALHIAATIPGEFSFMAARFLVSHHADISALNMQQQSPLDLARFHANENLIELLIYNSHHEVQWLPNNSCSVVVPHLEDPQENTFSYFLEDFKKHF
jgi:ankyrin repeat protein